MESESDSDRNAVDKERYNTSIRKLDLIFRNISETVDKVSRWRCPYKNVDGRCTAKFICRNQDKSVQDGELFICVGSDDLDYRSAWSD